MTKKFVNKYSIVGFGNAGYNAARAIRQNDPEAKICVYSDNDQVPSNPMLTTYYLKDSLDYQGMFPYGALERIITDLDLSFEVNKKVVQVFPEKKELLFEDGLIEPYHKLLIATGASAFVPNTQGMNLSGVFSIRTPGDAVALKDFLQKGRVRSMVVVGASMVGIKIVELACLMGISCTLLDGAAMMFPLAAFSNVSKLIEKELIKRGVELAFMATLSKVLPTDTDEQAEKIGNLAAVTSDGRMFYADAVVICIGTRANISLVKNSKIEHNRGILVNRKMQTNFPDVFAAGDCCEGYEMQFKKQRLIGLWANAGYQGRAAGMNMTENHTEFDYTIAHNITRFLEIDFISFGDVTSSHPNDIVYEYNGENLYLKATKTETGRITCINMIGGATVSGIIKSIYMKLMTEAGFCIDDLTKGVLLSSGIPACFIDFLGGLENVN